VVKNVKPHIVSNTPPGSPAGLFRHKAGNWNGISPVWLISALWLRGGFKAPLAPISQSRVLIAGGVTSIRNPPVSRFDTRSLPRGQLTGCARCQIFWPSLTRGPIRKSRGALPVNTSVRRSATTKSNTRIQVPSMCHAWIFMGLFLPWPAFSGWFGLSHRQLFSSPFSRPASAGIAF
jgi:hypothetical protein